MILAESDPIVRLFRLEPASPAELAWFLAGVASVIGAVALWSIAHHLRGERRRRAKEAESLESLLAEARFDAEDREAFLTVVRAAGAPARLCATSVEDFDRGVEGILRGTIEGGREELLRAIRSARRKLGLHVSRPGRRVLSTRALPSNLPVQVSVAGGPRQGCPVAGTLLSVDEEALTVRLEGSGTATARLFRGATGAEVFFIQPLDACYVFEARVIGMREAGAALLVLGHPSSLTRMQKRTFARVEVREEVPFGRIPALGSPGSASGSGPVPEDTAGSRGTITSLSGGGACLVTALPLERGELLQLSLPFLPEPYSREPFFARVLRSRDDFSHGLRFEGTGPSAQAAVLQFVRHEEARQARERSRRVAAEGEGSQSKEDVEVTLR
jgi:hypothetical protein